MYSIYSFSEAARGDQFVLIDELESMGVKCRFYCTASRPGISPEKFEGEGRTFQEAAHKAQHAAGLGGFDRLKLIPTTRFSDYGILSFEGNTKRVAPTGEAMGDYVDKIVFGALELLNAKELAGQSKGT